jgi:hypothetical protein
MAPVDEYPTTITIVAMVAHQNIDFFAILPTV